MARTALPAGGVGDGAPAPPRSPQSSDREKLVLARRKLAEMEASLTQLWHEVNRTTLQLCPPPTEGAEACLPACVAVLAPWPARDKPAARDPSSLIRFSPSFPVLCSGVPQVFGPYNHAC